LQLRRKIQNRLRLRRKVKKKLRKNRKPKNNRFRRKMTVNSNLMILKDNSKTQKINWRSFKNFWVILIAKIGVFGKFTMKKMLRKEKLTF